MQHGRWCRQQQPQYQQGGQLYLRLSLLPVKLSPGIASQLGPAHTLTPWAAEAPGRSQDIWQTFGVLAQAEEFGRLDEHTLAGRAWLAVL